MCVLPFPRALFRHRRDGNLFSVAVLLVVASTMRFGGWTGGDTSADAACEPTLTEADPTMGVEAEAVSTDDGEVWALIFNTWPMPAGDALRLPVDEEVKIVWRATGEGDLVLDAEGPDGEHLDPVWGPEWHGGSNWDRPGDEWGTGWQFPVTGCWSLHIQRDDVTATLDLDVFAPKVSTSARVDV